MRFFGFKRVCTVLSGDDEYYTGTVSSVIKKQKYRKLSMVLMKEGRARQISSVKTEDTSKWQSEFLDRRFYFMA